MEKILDYNLNVKANEKLPSLPVLHDFRINEIKIENGALIVTSNDVANYDESTAYVDFDAKSVRIEFSLEDQDECAAKTTVLIRNKKKWKKYQTFFGNEFVEIYKPQDLAIMNPMVSFYQVNLILWGKMKKKSVDVIMEIRCDKVKYIFSD